METITAAKKTKKIPDIGVENILQEIKNDPAPLK